MISLMRMEFRQFSWNEFKREYRGICGPAVIWKKIQHPRMGLTLVLDGDSAIYLPWYQGGDWRDGKPQIVPKPTAAALVRVPAVRINGSLLAIDGCHRLTSLRPRVVVVDWFEPKANERRYLTDCYNDFWRKRRLR